MTAAFFTVHDGLEREGPVEHLVVADAAERQALIERTLEGRAERLKEQGLTSRAFRDSGFRDFCTSLVARNDIDLRAFSLQHQGRPLAEQWGFVHGGRYYAYVASRDFSHSYYGGTCNEICRYCSASVSRRADSRGCLVF